MIDFVDARQKMIDGQLRPVDVTNLDLLQAMRDLPRERFVPAERAEIAYVDCDIPVSDSPPRFLLKAAEVARLIQATQVTKGERALVVGAGTGYTAAVLSRLASEVVALEDDAELARRARATLTDLGIKNVTVVTNPLKDGWPDGGPYDVIIVEGSIETVPDSLLRQLGEGGRLAAIVRSGSPGTAMLYRLDRGEVSARPVFNAAAPALPGFEKPPAFVF